MRPVLVLIYLLFIAPSAAWADEKAFKMSVSASLQDSNFLKHLLPRFSLKTGVRVTLSGPNTQADVILAEDIEGTPVFAKDDTIWFLSKASQSANVSVNAFEAWILSDVGKRTIEAFEIGGKQVFTTDVAVQSEEKTATIAGNTDEGEALALHHCGRCHVINESNKMNAIGSSPSFAVLRALSDWDRRFQSFYVLNPHPAFTQIEGITDAFDPERPSPIVPMELSVENLGAILDFVSVIPPADLGAPIQSQ